MGTLALGYPVRRYLRPFETLTPDTGHAWHTNVGTPARSASVPPQTNAVRRLRSHTAHEPAQLHVPVYPLSPE